MYVITAYDVEAKRTQLFKKTCQRFLSRVQNSVFEGNLTRAQLMKLTHQLKQLIKSEEMVKLWVIADNQIFTIHTLGTQKQFKENFL